MNDYIELPKFVFKQVLTICRYFDNRFNGDLPVEHDAINKIENKKVRLAALINFDSEVRKLILDYIKKYSDYLRGIEKWINNMRTQNKTLDFSYSDVYAMFIERELIYELLQIKIAQSITVVKIEIRVEDKYLQQKPSKPKYRKLTALEVQEKFHKLFINPLIEGEFIALLKKHDYIFENGKWKGNSERPGELREAYLVLKGLNLLEPGKHALESLRVLYLKFGLQPEEPGIKMHYISTRALGDKKSTKDHDQFLEIFQCLANKGK